MAIYLPLTSVIRVTRVEILYIVINHGFHSPDSYREHGEITRKELSETIRVLPVSSV